MSKLPWESKGEDASLFKSEVQLESSLERKEFYGHVCSLKVAVGTYSSQEEEPKTYIKLQSDNGFKVTPLINWECTCQGLLERSILVKALKHIVASLEAKTPLDSVVVTPIEFSTEDFSVDSPVEKPKDKPKPRTRTKRNRAAKKPPTDNSGVPVDTDVPLETDTLEPNIPIPENLKILLSNPSTRVKLNTNRLVQLYSDVGIPPSRFAKINHIHASSFRNFLKGVSNSCTSKILIKIANGLNVSVGELIEV